MKFALIACFVAAVGGSIGAAESSKPTGVPVTYALPNTPGETYRVTLAIVDPANPDWIISQFAAGVARTVTAENAGRFTETWNGLDDNFMPVPPGKYAVKGIYMPARKWAVDGDWHTVTPRFAGGASPWLPTPEQVDVPAPFGGDPVNAPMMDVAVGPSGIATFYYQYLENGTNLPQFDLNKPLGPGQFLRAYKSGGAGGGPCVATDGENVWAFSTDGGPKFVYRADGKSFGSSPTANRRNSYPPAGWVTAMTASRDAAAGKSYVFVAQRGKIVSEKQTGSSFSHRYAESATDLVDEITVHDGDNGKVLQTLKLARPRGLVVRADKLFALHADGNGFAISTVSLEKGLPKGEWATLFKVPEKLDPADLEVDSRRRIYLSDRAANHVYQFDATGKSLLTFGKLDVQRPGTYDRDTLMAPAKLATWTDADGKDRLIVVEMAGPNRVSEWSADDGKLLREFMSYQTKCNSGYTIDPADASLIYLPGHDDWLTRFKVDYDKHTWTVDAVWPNVESGQRGALEKPIAVRVNGNLYLASERSLSVYRLAGDRWLKSAGLIFKDKAAFLWNDTNGNGQADEDELRPTEMPKGVMTYHGQKWLADLSYIAPGQGSRDVWRLAPEGFDAHGNPVFKGWQKVLTDPVFMARVEGKTNALYGGNELTDTFSSDWMQVDGSAADGFYVQARGGKNFTANFGAQHKISRYLPDGKGGYRIKWRVGRSVIDGSGAPDELHGGMRCFKPINGLLTIVDQSRSGLLLFTEDGLFVDSIFPKSDKEKSGIYQQPGEFFAGTIYPNAANGKVYYAAGKYTPLLYEMEGWSLAQNPVKPLTTVQNEVTINAAQIASPPEQALALRGGAGTAPIARFAPALGGAELDGTIDGWESAEPVKFASGKQSVEVRSLYDPDTLYLRWHVRLDRKFEAKSHPPLERLFTHDVGADTVSFFVQGDVNAEPKGQAVGRPGDARFVFGLFKDGGTVRPAYVGMYPHYPGASARPQTYRTPVGTAAFAHVGPVEGVTVGHAIDADGEGFVIAASIPRAALPALKTPFGPDLRTMVNFDANLGGHDRFWWANRDGSASRETYDEPSEARLYPGSWAPAQFVSLAGGAVVRNWLVCGPFGGPGAEKFKNDPNGPVPGTNIEMKKAVREFCDAAVYPPDAAGVDLAARYKGDQIKGYWPDPKEVRWKPAAVAELDTRVVLGGGAQTYYGATWVYAPADTRVEFDLQGHAQTTIRWAVNNQPVEPKTYAPDPAKTHRLTATQKVDLKRGWNAVTFRAYCTGYAPFRVGLIVDGTPEQLWKLKFAATPPTAR